MTVFFSKRVKNPMFSALKRVDHKEVDEYQSQKNHTSELSMLKEIHIVYKST